MLTITAPIELKCKAPVTSAHEGFYHRINDNYAMITQNLAPEDLLHVMTTPPEYYFGEGDQTNIFQQTNRNRFQENRLEIVNNLINRITVSEAAELTYQDRVYITGILQKFGIHNVSEFMHQVSLVKEEHQNTKELINLYWNHAGELRQLVQNYKNEQQTDQLTQQVNEQQETLHLHEDIMNRLQTAALYQTVQNFNSRPQGDTTITNTELMISDQSRIAQNILLQKLKNEARDEQTPLIYRHENYFEEQELTQEQLSEQTLLRQINSAVMLNLIDNVYQTRTEQTKRAGDTWYHMEQAFYRNADNTMQRFENRMDARYSAMRSVNNDYRTEQTIADRREIHMISQLFEDQGSEQYQVVNQLLQQDFIRQELTNRILEQTDEEYLNELLSQEHSQYYTDRSSQIVNSLMDQRTLHQEVTENRLLRQTIEQQNRTRREGDRYENHTDLTQMQINEGDVIAEEHTFVEEQHTEYRDFSTVEQEISRINRENINNQSKYIRMMEGIRESMEHPREKKTAEQMRRESLMSLEHPTELLEQLREEGAQEREQREQKLEQAIRILPEQTRAVYETLREYIEAPQELRKQMTGVSDDMGMLIRDIHAAEVQHEQTMLVHREQEQIYEQTKEVVERWNEKTPQAPKQQTVYEDRRTDLSLVHRSQEQTLDEELIQQMMEQNRQINRTVKTENETVTNYDTTEHTYTNVNTQQVVQQTENINELVRQGVQRELGTLSDKIYSKLEKRLETERRRRGY